jgi:hypothetical protein
MENRHGLSDDAMTTCASGHVERLAAIVLIEARADRPRPMTVAADKACDTGDLRMELRERTHPHVAQNNGRRRSAIDGRTTRHPGYAVSQRTRKRIEGAFAWAGACRLLRRADDLGCRNIGAGGDRAAARDIPGAGAIDA